MLRRRRVGWLAAGLLAIPRCRGLVVRGLVGYRGPATPSRAAKASDAFRVARGRRELACDALLREHDEIVLDPAGVDLRRRRLDAALKEIGFDAESMETDARLRGSSAMKIYRGFVHPKTDKALAMSSMPQRAASVAAQVSVFAREAVAANTAWLRNHDLTLNDETRPPPPHDLTIILDGLRSGENVGSIIRTVETAGCRRIIACGTTPRPPNSAVLKAACNSADHVLFEHEPSVLAAVLKLQGEGVVVWACETTTEAQTLYDVEAPRPLALVFGNERYGIAPDVMEACDAVVQIPVFGVKNSLNVANAAAVAAFEVLRQWRRNDFP
mmetsp:Transcript_188/g.701  ORF Transcript_188/g.701 Transcript_188/m.701 type:complete len:327 (-) Transcript_188:13-993(-)